MLRRALALVIVICAFGVAHAQPRNPASAPPRAASREMKVAILLASDKSSTDTALPGLDTAKKRGRLAVAVRLAPHPDELGSTIDRLAANAPELIIGVGAVYTDAFRTASERHPATRFLLLDAELPNIPNVKAMTFRADEGSFLAGVAAAAESKRGAVGFVGAMETPISQALECAYETGVRWAAKELKRTVRGSLVYIGTTAEAFSDPAHGAAVSRTMIAQKHVDVLYAAAGASSAGVIEAAREAKVKAITVDTEQSYLNHDVFITSVRKRLARAIETVIADVRKQAFHGGVVEMNLANGGVDLALPGRLARETQKLVEKARAAIVAGRHAACVKYEEQPPAWNFPPRPVVPAAP